ncbi:branched-chain amino acid ABC transporter permease [Celeribacter persicus]|jgi:Branched-chain amino acid ABC-type transport system, permease components|uniref:Amino acid/amide ABC transporter membrane protein 1 (HAAT family) n=1 Tax=Celeribacter persicus TaxID=1651082 RepID=A0A2T5H589_9RHOB|nr:branched-chain amino acid ABC transporter permease [Celeribacter persicus]PTQ66699.1 amino acid/amide ABC transporter membrane protein 1 (HAAT family) [Celeribacter persicus]
MVWINAVLQGVLLGGLYALFAAGLSLMFGVMRFINMAHGDFIITAAYLLLALVTGFAIHPALAVPLVIVALAAAGYLNQRILLNRVLGKDILPPVLVTFGLSIIIQNALLEVFSADSQKLQAGWLDTASFKLSEDLAIGALPLLMFLAAVAVIAGLQFVFYKTPLGRMLRATSDDPEIVPLMGGSNAHIFAIATALASVVVAIAGIFLAMKTNFDPAAGPARLLFAFEVVIIGGLGSLWGTLIGGIILGVAQTVGAQIDTGSQVLAGHLVFLALLVVRPRGLFPKT